MCITIQIEPSEKFDIPDAVVRVRKNLVMSTVTIKQPTITVNFLARKKTTDWRYGTWETLFREPMDKLRFIYWIGVVHLLPIRPSVSEYPISYAGHGNLMVEDRYIQREPDGASGDLYPVMYDLSEILPELLKARDEGKNFFHLLLQEKVDIKGAHEVNILYKKKHPVGIATDLPWVEEPTKNWLAYMDQTIDKNVQLIHIMGNKPYNWQK